MTTCTCPIIAAPRGAKLKPSDTLNRASEHLLRARVLRPGDDPRVIKGAVKITVGESDAPDGNLAEDPKRAHIVFQNPAFGGAVISVPEHPDDAEPAIQVALEERQRHARYAATFRRMLDRVSGDTTPAVVTCIECGGDARVLDATLDATNRDPNDLIYRSPAGYWLRTRIWRVSAGEPGMGGLEGASNVHFELSTAHCHENGDVVEDDRGHRILAPWRFTIAGRSLLVDSNGRPSLSEDGALAIRLVQRAMLPAEAEIQRIESLARFPFKDTVEPTYRELTAAFNSEREGRQADRALASRVVDERNAELIALTRRTNALDDERLAALAAASRAANLQQEADARAREAHALALETKTKLDAALKRNAELEATQPKEET